MFTLRNAAGMEMRTTNHGGITLALSVPDRDGHCEDIVLGFDEPADHQSSAYRKAAPYFGAVIGRYANRLAEGRFRLDGETYPVATNAPLITCTAAMRASTRRRGQ